MYEWLMLNADGWQKLLGALAILVSFMGGIAAWFWKRVSSKVSAGVSGVEQGQLNLMNRINDVEKDVEGIESNMAGLGERMRQVEKGMSNLATSREVAALDRQIASLAATVEAQSTTMRMLYEAAMRADPSGGRQ